MPSLLYPFFVSEMTKSPSLKKNDFKHYRSAHNLLLCVFSFVVAMKTLFILSRKQGGLAFVCDRPEEAPLLEWTWYASKIWEWLDTFFIVASGRRVTSLHYNHHLTTPAVVASHMIFRPVRSSVFDLPMFLNAVAHTLMYAYYYDPAAFSFLKKRITIFQILQHVVALSCISISTSVALFSPHDALHCDVSILANSFSFLMYFMYLVQFCYFYATSYNMKEETPLFHEL